MKEKLQQLEVEQQHLRIVSEFAVHMLSLKTEREVVWYLAREVVAKLGFEDVVVYLYNESGGFLTQVAAYGDKNPQCEELDSPLEMALGEGVVGTCAKNREPLLVNDTREFPGYVVDDKPRLSELSVPMIANDQLIGVIDSEHTRQDFFNERHLRTVVAMASIAATKLFESRSTFKLQQSIEQLEYTSKIQDTLFEIAELIFQTECIAEFYRRLHGCIGRLIFSDNFYVALITEDGKGLTFPYFVDNADVFADDDVIPLGVDKPPSITEFVVTNGKPLLVYGDEVDDMHRQGIIKVKGTLPEAWMGIPFGSNELKGVVAVQSYSKEFIFGEKDKQLMVFAAKHIRNAIERMKARTELKFLALHDPLTQLPNRLLFADRIEHAVQNAQRKTGVGLAVLFLDLDRFKQVNDTYGHHVGDLLLIEVSQAIAECIEEFDTLARLGGDEFAVLLENREGKAQVEKVAKDIIAKVQIPVLLEQFQINTSTSIGVTWYDGGNIEAESLLKQADEAMYQAKLHGRNQLWHYDNQAGPTSTGTYKVERDFVQAIENQDLFCQYQPVIDMATGQIVGAEALVRWDHHEQGILPPGAFLPELEKAGYIYQLDLYVLAKALDFLSSWQNTLSSQFRLNVNISGAGFTSSSLLDILTKTHKISPQLLSHLCIEITEQSIVNSVELTKKRMTQLQGMGISIALDDFGTGYSSLSYLQQYRFDHIKIDRSFVQNQKHDEDNCVILDTIINLAKSLNVKTTAEGIETQAQFKRLQSLQCHLGQGFYMSRPLDESQLIELISSGVRYG